MKQDSDAHRGRGSNRCGSADLSLTPLLPAPWPLQLRGDREVIIGGGRGTKKASGAMPLLSPRAHGELIQLNGQAAVREVRTMVSLLYHAHGAIPILNLLSSPFTETVITLGFSCWLSERPLPTESDGSLLMSCHTSHSVLCTHTKTKKKITN